MNKNKNLPDERVAIVTGVGKGLGGLGAAIATRFAENGMRMVISDLTPAVEEVAEEIRAETGAEVQAVVGDLSTMAGAATLVQAAIDRWGQVDVLVNNAGSGIIQPFLDHDEESLRETINRNLWTTVFCCHQALDHMVKRSYGRIVNIGGDSTRTGIPGHAGYNAAKGGVEGMSVGLAKEFALHDITINTVAPCVINTTRMAGAMKTKPELAEAILAVVPKGRPVEISEIVSAVEYLASDDARFITGQVLSVNGGAAMP
ncbi:MAG: SDR family oxidoreductase [Alphaproteobacteria bacterium]|nr:MAG: SDR family oxidoreductase [Alphaproteobacteria bacterium]